MGPSDYVVITGMVAVVNSSEYQAATSENGWAEPSWPMPDAGWVLAREFRSGTVLS